MTKSNQLEDRIKELTLFSDKEKGNGQSIDKLAGILMEIVNWQDLLEERVTQLEGLLQERDEVLREDLSDLLHEMAREINSFQSLWRVDSNHQRKEAS